GRGRALRKVGRHDRGGRRAPRRGRRVARGGRSPGRGATRGRTRWAALSAGPWGGWPGLDPETARLPGQRERAGPAEHQRHRRRPDQGAPSRPGDGDAAVDVDAGVDVAGGGGGGGGVWGGVGGGGGMG